MTKMFETKEKILTLLQKDRMRLSELANKLNLTAPTVKQHLDELEQEGKVKRSINPFFRKDIRYGISEAVPASQAVAQNIAVDTAVGQGTPARSGTHEDQGALREHKKIPSHIMGILAIVLITAAIFGYVSIGKGKRAQISSSISQTQQTSALTSISQVTTVTSGTTILSNNYTGNSITTNSPKLYYSSGACAGSVMPGRTSVQASLGFESYSISGIHDYVINSGASGVLVYNTTETESISSSTEITNILYLYDIANGNTYTVPGSPPPGFNITMIPGTEVLSGKSSYFNTVLRATAGASGTYWAVANPCYGNTTIFLLTVGSSPYSGSLTNQPVLYVK